MSEPSGISLDRDVSVACVYIPPAGSAQLLLHSLSERMSSLKAAVTSAQAHGHVILGSGFYVKVAGMDDVLVPDRQFLEGSGIPCQSGCSYPSVNLHGHLLVDLCLATSTLLGTGCVPGDAHAPASFSRAAWRAGWIISSSAGTSSPPCSALRWRASILTPTISRSC